MIEYPWPVGSVSKRAYDALEPVAGADEATGWSLLTYIDALGQMFQFVANYAEDDAQGVPGWSAILDIDRVPNEALPWLAQFMGVKIDLALPFDEQRQQIRSKETWRRSTRRAMIDAARQYLSGGKVVSFRERDNSPYRLTVVTYAGETNVTFFGYGDMFANKDDYQEVWDFYSTYQDVWEEGSGVSLDIQQALLDQKPGGIVLEYRVIDAQDYWTLRENNVNYQQVDNRYATYQLLYEDSPVPAPPEIYSTFWTDDYNDLYNEYESYQILYDYFNSY